MSARARADRRRKSILQANNFLCARCGAKHRCTGFFDDSGAFIVVGTGSLLRAGYGVDCAAITQGGRSIPLVTITLQIGDMARPVCQFCAGKEDRPDG
jgi:hypothetical protein